MLLQVGDIVEIEGNAVYPAPLPCDGEVIGNVIVNCHQGMRLGGDGVIAGNFDPLGIATREEGAQMFRNFAEKVIK